MQKCSICHHRFDNIYNHVASHVIKGGISGVPISLIPRHRAYPDSPILRPRAIWFDHFDRLFFEETNQIDMYDTGGTGAGSFTFPNITTYPQHGGRMTTGAAIGDEQTMQTRYTFTVGKQDITKMIVKIKGRLGQTADTELFIGFYEATSASTPSALPTTQSHAGIVLDRSVSANWRMSSADGAVQEIDTSSLAADSSDHTFQIIWSTTPSVEFLVDATSLGTHTVSTPDTLNGHVLIMLIQTEGLAAKIWDYDMLRVEYF